MTAHTKPNEFFRVEFLCECEVRLYVPPLPAGEIVTCPRCRARWQKIDGPAFERKPFGEWGDITLNDGVRAIREEVFRLRR